MSRQDRKLTVALFWHSVSSDNLGVGALTIANVYILEKIASELGVSLHLVLIGPAGGKFYADDLPVSSDRIDYVILKGVFPKKINVRALRCISRFDVAIDIGEGDSFSDIYGTSRFIKQVATKVFVLLLRKPLLLAPQTIGPFEGKYAGFLAAKLLEMAAVVCARDVKSYEVAKNLGAKNLVQCTDVALVLPFNSGGAEGGGENTIGLNVSALLYHGGYNRANQFGLQVDYRSLVERLIEQLLKRRYKVVLVPHVFSSLDVEDDYAVSGKLAAKFNGVEIAPKFDSPVRAKSYISGLGMLIGSRMHATIAALSSGVPVVPVAYSRKFSGLFETLGCHDTIELTDGTVDSVLNEILSRVETVSEWGAVQKGAMVSGLRFIDAYEEQLRSCLRSLVEI